MEKSRFRNRAGNNSVEVTVKGPNTSAMKDTVNRVENDD